MTDSKYARINFWECIPFDHPLRPIAGESSWIHYQEISMSADESGWTIDIHGCEMETADMRVILKVSKSGAITVEKHDGDTSIIKRIN